MSDDIFKPHTSPPPRRQPYLAYGLVKDTKPALRIDIHRHDGSVFPIESASLYDVCSTSDEYCSLIYDRCTLEFRGYHLGALVELLKHYDIRFAECFDATKHLPPPLGYPMIDRIRWKHVLVTPTRFVRGSTYQSNIPLIRMA